MDKQREDEYPVEKDDADERVESVGEPMVADNEVEEATVKALDPDAPPA